MRASVLALSRFLATALAICCLASCSSPKTGRSQAKRDGTQVIEKWKPHLLYLLASPHARLHAEVDAVQGCEPDEAMLKKLRSFLSAHCRKPEGIDIVRSDVIPTEAARGFSEKALARKYIDGPDKTNVLQPAFMYMLFYNDALCQRLSTNKAGASLPGRRGEIANPYTDVVVYPAIYFNTRYVSGAGEREALRHETGHILGLTSRADEDAGRHCRSGTCLMNTTLRMSRWLLGMQRGLCKACKTELQQSLAQPPVANVRYSGAVLVRSEGDYNVITLPDRVGIMTGSVTDQDCQNFVQALRAEKSGESDHERSRMYCMVKDAVFQEPSKRHEILKRLKGDVLEDVRTLGPRLFLRGCAERYQALGQYTNAVATLGEAILLDSKNARLYNSLAWMKATCSDASVRNGEEAVTAATKACELTEWKNWMFVDTLAAAHAEAGDFKRAMEFQEKAMRTGNPGESEQESMRERLSLYKQLRPFREKREPGE
jgi:hypothetical protein